MGKYTAFSGWMLDQVIQIDADFAGFAGHVLRASTVRRHVIAAYLSRQRPHKQFESLGEVGRFLASARHDEILAAAFNTPSPRLRSLLARAGSQPYARHHYLYVHSLLKSEQRRKTQRLVRTLNPVNPTRLKIARVLPESLQWAPLVEALRSVEQARDLARLVSQLTCSGVDQSSMIAALRLARKPEDIRRFARKWSMKATFPAHPVARCDHYSPVENGEQLVSVARAFRNCARTYVAHILDGRSSFATVSLGNHQAVVHLTRKTTRWTLEDIYGSNNDQPDAKLVEWTTRRLAAANIVRHHEARADGEWDCLRRLAGHLALDDW